MKSMVEDDCAEIDIPAEDPVGILDIVMEGELPVLSYDGVVYDCFDFNCAADCGAEGLALLKSPGGDIYQVVYTFNGGPTQEAPYEDYTYPIQVAIPESSGIDNTYDITITELSSGKIHDPKVVVSRRVGADYPAPKPEPR